MKINVTVEFGVEAPGPQEAEETMTRLLGGACYLPSECFRITACVPAALSADERSVPVQIAIADEPAVKPCCYCYQRPAVSADSIDHPPELKTAWSLTCECGRGYTSQVSYDDAVAGWNRQADDRQLAADSARFKRDWMPPRSMGFTRADVLAALDSPGAWVDPSDGIPKRRTR